MNLQCEQNILDTCFRLCREEKTKLHAATSKNRPPECFSLGGRSIFSNRIDSICEYLNLCVNQPMRYDAIQF